MANNEILDNNVAIAVIDPGDMVPKKIPASIILESGHKESFLLKKCQEYKITLRKLEDLVCLRTQFKAGLERLIELNQEGYSINEIEYFLSIREATAGVTIKTIIELWKTFNKPEDPGCLSEAIMKICSEFDIFPSQALKRIIETAHKLGQYEIEGVMDFLLIDEEEIQQAFFNE